VHEQAANELARVERHGCVPLGTHDAVVFLFDRDTCRIARNQVAVGDGDAMGVAGEATANG